MAARLKKKVESAAAPSAPDASGASSSSAPTSAGGGVDRDGDVQMAAFSTHGNMTHAQRGRTSAAELRLDTGEHLPFFFFIPSLTSFVRFKRKSACCPRCHVALTFFSLSPLSPLCC